MQCAMCGHRVAQPVDEFGGESLGTPGGWQQCNGSISAAEWIPSHSVRGGLDSKYGCELVVSPTGSGVFELCATWRGKKKMA